MKNTTKNYALLRAFAAIALLIGFSLPFSLYASVRYGYNPNNGRYYMLPGRELSAEELGSSSGGGSGGLSVSCAPSGFTAAVGQTVTWFSSVAGGTGSYLYTWSGTEGLAGNGITAQKAYATKGEKIATLTVTSGNRLITVSCGSVIVGGGSFGGSSFGQGGFGASCYAVPERAALGESVTWLALVSGVTSATIYSWDGSDTLSGDRPLVSKTYATAGHKVAMLTVTNGNDRIIAPCTNAVAVGLKVPATPQRPAVPSTPPKEPEQTVAREVEGLCAPSSSKATSGEKVQWRAVAVGGTGEYRFLWSGDDKLAGNAATTSAQYKTAGIKRTAVEIQSGDTTKTVVCYPIEITKGSNGNGANGFSASALFSWIDGPVGVILAAILAIIFGIFIALRKRSKEEAEEEERDHEH